MSTGHGGGLPDYSGGADEHGRGGAGSAQHQDPYAQQSDPYAQRPDPYAQRSDPYAQPQDPYALDRSPYEPGPDPYASGHDPYARSHDPLTADGFAPVFGESASAPARGYGVPVPPAGAAVYGSFPPRPVMSGMAITGFVVGLAGLFLCGGLVSPIGIIFSALGLRETGPDASPPAAGRGLAVAGLVTSLIGLVPLILMGIYVVLMFVGTVVSSST